ncbi:MAG: GIY-YIG nuclease family protein [Gracilimonas sp.]|nr:GIY-YIG nuclease family protein [Gracilimonas sp.]
MGSSSGSYPLAGGRRFESYPRHYLKPSEIFSEGFFIFREKRGFMFTVYVLYSPSHEKIYIGYTSNLEQRMLSHNRLGKKGWTIRYRPWEIVFTEEFEEKAEAMKRK